MDNEYTERANSLGIQLRAMRHRKGLSIKAAAERMGIPYATYWTYDHGVHYPSRPSHITKIREFLQEGIQE